MKFNPGNSIPVLMRTPVVLRSLLSGLDEEWTMNNDGTETWSPYDVIGHLIHGEKTDWIVRAKIILSEGDKTFEPFDRFAQFNDSKGKTLLQLLDEFEILRNNNIAELEQLNITEEMLENTGVHPEFGAVTLRQLLATWVAHDLGHIVQISRTMARQYKDEVGPWKAYLSVMG